MSVPYPLSLMGHNMLTFKINYSARRKMKKGIEKKIPFRILILSGGIRKPVGL